MRGDGCADCVVTFLTVPVGAPDLDDAERGAIEVLASSGLVPPLRLVAELPDARVVRAG